MQSKISLKWPLFIVSSIIIAFSLIFIFFLILDVPTEDIGADLVLPVDNNQVLQNPIIERPGLPVSLKIPKINVSSTIEYVGLTKDGAMDVPKNQASVAWFELGWRPGEIGNAVIAGHYGWKDKKASAFNNLYKLRKGDKIYVEDDKGTVITFVVRENRRYDSKAKAPSVFGSNDGRPYLSLITCEGTWNKDQESYSSRLVVFAEKE